MQQLEALKGVLILGCKNFKSECSAPLLTFIATSPPYCMLWMAETYGPLSLLFFKFIWPTWIILNSIAQVHFAVGSWHLPLLLCLPSVRTAILCSESAPFARKMLNGVGVQALNCHNL